MGVASYTGVGEYSEPIREKKKKSFLALLTKLVFMANQPNVTNVM